MRPLSYLTSCTPTKSNLYLANSLVTVVSEPALYRLLTFHVPKTMSLFRCLPRGASSRNTPHRRSEWGSSLPPDCFVSRGSISPCEYFITRVFHGETLLALRPTPNLEDYPSSAVRDCLFNLFAATLHIGGRSSIRNLRTRHAVVIGLQRFSVAHWTQSSVLWSNGARLTTYTAWLASSHHLHNNTDPTDSKLRKLLSVIM